jgi:HTH-type transcriptional regulator / antitoxin HigA
LMDQHDLTRAEMVPMLGSQTRVAEVLQGKKGLSITMVQRLRARFHIPADVLLPLPLAPPRNAARRRTKKRAAA